MSILGCISLRCRYYSRLSSAVSYRYPVPKDLLSGSAPRPDWTSNADRRPMQLCWTVNRLIFLRDLDTAAEYARLAYSHFYCNSTVTTCESIIKAMCEVKRYRDALDLFHHFYNELKLCSIYNSPNYIVKALCELGRLEDALVLFRAMPCQGSITYCHLTKALVYAGRLDEALCLVRKHPMPLSCSNLIRGFLNLGNLCMANQLLDEFESNGFWHIDEKSQPGLLRVALIEHSLKQGNDEEAMRGYRYLVCNDRFIYGDTGNALLQLLMRFGKKTQAWELFHRMIDGVGQVGLETIDTMVRVY